MPTRIGMIFVRFPILRCDAPLPEDLVDRSLRMRQTDLIREQRTRIEGQ